MPAVANRRGRKPLSPEGSEKIQVRLTRADAARIRELAAAHHKTVAAVVRELVVTRLAQLRR